MKISRSKLRSYLVVSKSGVEGSFRLRRDARKMKAALGGKANGVSIQVTEVTREVR